MAMEGKAREHSSTQKKLRRSLHSLMVEGFTEESKILLLNFD